VEFVGGSVNYVLSYGVTTMYDAACLVHVFLMRLVVAKILNFHSQCAKPATWSMHPTQKSKHPATPYLL
jgi:hypothetical protein